MKSFINLIIFINCLFLFKAVIPVWNLTKAGQELDLPYTYTAYDKYWNEYHLTMTRTIQRNGDILNYTNYVKVYKTNDESYSKSGTVDFDHIGSFFHIDGKFYICPKGKYHLYDFTNGKYIIPNNFGENGGLDYELKCTYHSTSSVFIAFYLMNGEKAMHAIYVINGKMEDISYKVHLGDELYDYRISEEKVGDNDYLLLSLDKLNSKLQLNTFKATLKSDYQGVNSIKSLPIEEAKTNLQACFRDESSKYPYDFFYITYTDLSDLKSGYSTFAPTSWEDFSDVKFKNNDVADFEFLEDLVIEEIKFMFNNRFVYYKLKINGNSNTSYYGVFDTKLNKVLFNTNQYIKYYLPYSETSMLAITESSAYKICVINNNNECTDNCDENKYYLDTEGNKCDNPSCPSDKVTLVPSGVCNQTCDNTYFVEINGTCGLCKYFNQDGAKYKLIGSTKCLKIEDINNKMEEFSSKLGLYKCISPYILKNNDCVRNANCPENCTDCDNDKCTKCKEGFLLDDGACKEHCSEGKKPDGKECVNCNMNNCDNFILDSCNCTKCKEHNYLDDSKCYSCDNNCKSCAGNSTNCTECLPGDFLEKNHCYSCSNPNCQIKESDNCRCKTCKEGYFLNSTYICESCIANCASCQNTTTCDICKEGFHKDQKGSCIQCPNNCGTRKPNSCECETCNEYSYMDANHECQNCSSPCKSCEESATNCTKCIDGFFMNETEKCEKCDETKCETCSSNKEHCDSCKVGKYLVKENSTCQNCDEHCETCSSGANEESYNCLSCKTDTEYKYLIKDDYLSTCVKNCTENGREFVENSFVCKPLKRDNKTEDDTKNNGKKDEKDYLLWIFVAVVGVLLIIITICICKKCCGDKNNNELIEEINTELDEKNPMNEI